MRSSYIKVDLRLLWEGNRIWHFSWSHEGLKEELLQVLHSNLIIWASWGQLSCYQIWSLSLKSELVHVFLSKFIHLAWWGSEIWIGSCFTLKFNALDFLGSEIGARACFSLELELELVDLRLLWEENRIWHFSWSHNHSFSLMRVWKRNCHNSCTQIW